MEFFVTDRERWRVRIEEAKVRCRAVAPYEEEEDYNRNKAVPIHMCNVSRLDCY